MNRQLLILLLLPFILTACKDDEKKEDTDKSLAPKSVQPPTVHEQELEKFTGARTKLVWAQYQNPDKYDKQGHSRNQFLMALDSNDGRGEHKVLEESGNYAYPIISPDGERIVFTRKTNIDKNGKRRFDVTMEVVNFDGTGQRKLGEGYAQEIWEDPDTGIYWVYAGEEFVWASGTAPVCKRIIRLQLDDPSKREVVWEKTLMGTDSFAISADGKRFAGLAPWPYAGVGDLKTLEWKQLVEGCWTSMAADNSYRCWVFDGPHKNLNMFDSAGEPTGVVAVNTHPALKGKSTYHPRWGNDPRFVVLSGPYDKTKKKGRGKKVEIFIGKFSPEFDRIESWFQASKNKLADIYPDIWVEGADSAKSPPATGTKEIAKKSTGWPSNPEGLLLKWENADMKNEFIAPDGSDQVTRLSPTGFARFGKDYEMVLQGGNFEPVLDSEGPLEKYIPDGKFFFQCLVSADSPSGVIARAENFKLRLQERSIDGKVISQLLLEHDTGALFNFGEVDFSKPTHLVVNSRENEAAAYINGELVEARSSGDATAAAADPIYDFGTGLIGTLEHVAFYNRPIPASEVAADFALIKKGLEKRKPAERIELKGKLVAMSTIPDLESIEPYVRALVYYAYETDKPGLEEIAVAHWAILDKKPVPGLDRKIGETYDLIIEPKDAHPQLKSQAEEVDVEMITLTPYYDVSPISPSE